MKCVAVVPMKLNNRRLPGKNTKTFTNGKPLCTYVLNTLLSTNVFDDVYVYCSDITIKKFLPEGVKLIIRSKSLDQDSTKMNEILIAFSNEIDADIYLMTHATAPFITKESIINGINAVKSEKYDSAFAVKLLQDFLWKDEKPLNYDLDDIPRTQDLPPIYMETSGFYCYKKDVVTKMHRRIGNNPKLVIVNDIESIDIDEIDDFLLADAIFNSTLYKERYK